MDTFYLKRVLETLFVIREARGKNNLITVPFLDVYGQIVRMRDLVIILLCNTLKFSLGCKVSNKI